MKFLRHILLAACSLIVSGCMSWDYGIPEDFNGSGRGLFIVNEGNFQYGNASLSFYDPATQTVENDIFLRANGMKLGDVAQSMTAFNDLGWIAVNNSNVIFAIDLTTYRERGRITGLSSPRYIHFVGPMKAYVTQLWDNRIAIVDPQAMKVTGHITIPGMETATGSTEQMVSVGRYVYVACWSYQREILKIDIQTDEIVGRLTIGFQPNSIAADAYGRLWALTSGGGGESPALYRIDLTNFAVDAVFEFFPEAEPSELTIGADGSRLYWINEGVWAMEVGATRLPLRPIIRSRSTLYYGLTVDPDSEEIYLADAIDFQQRGTIYRYSPEGTLIDSFETGITPGAFCWVGSR